LEFSIFIKSEIADIPRRVGYESDIYGMKDLEFIYIGVFRGSPNLYAIGHSWLND
jgi:hypothetical protein